MKRASPVMIKEINGEMIDQDSLILKHGKLVHFICKPLRFRAEQLGLDYEDIVSIEFIGLLNAFRNYDRETYNLKFSTYAFPTIRHEILRTLTRNCDIINYSRGIKDLAQLIRKKELEDQSTDAIAKTLNVKRNKVVHALQFIRNGRPQSLDKALQSESGDEDITLSDTISAATDTTGMFVAEFIQSLSDREKVIVGKLLEGISQAEIGKEIGTHQVHVSRMQKKIREKYLRYFGPN